MQQHVPPRLVVAVLAAQAGCGFLRRAHWLGGSGAVRATASLVDAVQERPVTRCPACAAAISAVLFAVRVFDRGKAQDDTALYRLICGNMVTPPGNILRAGRSDEHGARLIAAFS